MLIGLITTPSLGLTVKLCTPEIYNKLEIKFYDVSFFVNNLNEECKLLKLKTLSLCTSRYKFFSILSKFVICCTIQFQETM